MAQLAEKHRDAGNRVRSLLRQRPGIAIAVLLATGSIVGAVACGAMTARHASGADGGFAIERDEPSMGSAEGNSRAADARNVEEADPAPEDEALVVDVSGAVASPAVVELEQGARVQDAIEAAGGLAPDADISALNRAAPCTDGQKVYVPRQGEAVAAASGATAGGDAPAGGRALVNINTADEAALDALPGVGPSTAQAIVEDREANGPFASIEDLMRVSGIGDKKFEKLKSAICV